MTDQWSEWVSPRRLNRKFGLGAPALDELREAGLAEKGMQGGGPETMGLYVYRVFGVDFDDPTAKQQLIEVFKMARTVGRLGRAVVG